ncbi:unnamed protein product, partial [Musa banksii]
MPINTSGEFHEGRKKESIQCTLGSSSFFLLCEASTSSKRRRRRRKPQERRRERARWRRSRWRGQGQVPLQRGRWSPWRQRRKWRRRSSSSPWLTVDGKSLWPENRLLSCEAEMEKDDWGYLLLLCRPE